LSSQVEEEEEEEEKQGFFSWIGSKVSNVKDKVVSKASPTAHWLYEKSRYGAWLAVTGFVVVGFPIITYFELSGHEAGSNPMLAPPQVCRRSLSVSLLFLFLIPGLLSCFSLLQSPVPSSTPALPPQPTGSILPSMPSVSSGIPSQ
jgi:hypothetical protein